jgi:hypothetical protein
VKGVDFALGNYVKAFKDRPFWYRRLKGSVRGFYWLIWMEAGRDGLIGLDDTPREKVGEALALLFDENVEVATYLANQLFECGAIHFSAGQRGNALVVVDYVAAQTTPTLDKVRAKDYRQRKHDDAVSSSSSRAVTPRHAPSRAVTTIDQIRDRERSEIDQISPNGECEGDKPPPKTDPTPTLRKQQLDEVLGKGSAAWGMDGSGQAHDDPAKAQTPTPRPAPPSPPAARPAPVVAGVDHKPVQGQIPPAAGVASRPSTLLDLGPPNAPRKALAKKPTAKKAPAGTHAGPPQTLPLPEDWAPNDAHYEFGRELGLQKKHVDYFAGEMRDRAVSDGWVSGNWNAKFRNFMRKGLEFRRGEPPVVPDPLPPKRPMPPCPPPPPEVLARAEVWKQRMEAGELPDLSKLFKPGKFVVPPVEKVEGFNGFAEECTG